MGDSERRKFEAEIQSTLQTFEKAREWADLTNYLNRLHKAIIKAHSSFHFVPYPELLARRLGQCLNPILPGGVHAKCLEVYGAVFSRIGTDGLSQDLGLWSSGLFPTYQDAASHVKAIFLDLIENNYLPLKQRLLPCLTGLIVCILPGLEEQSDLSSRVLLILKRISIECVKPQQFTAALWTVLLRTERVRLPALQLLQAILPQDSLALAQENEVAIYLPNKGSLVLRAFERLFLDPNVLVKRQLLDIVIKHFPLDSHIFTFQEKVRCLRASFCVLIDREWSLTRRLLHWITGQPDVLDEVDLSYFKTQVREELCTAFCEELADASDTTEKSKAEIVLTPLKVIRVFLAEADELAALVIQRLAVPILQFLEKVSLCCPDPTIIAMVIDESRIILTSNSSSTALVWNSLELMFEERLSSFDPIGSIAPLRLSLRFYDQCLNRSKEQSQDDATLEFDDAAVAALSRILVFALRALSMDCSELDRLFPLIDFSHQLAHRTFKAIDRTSISSSSIKLPKAVNDFLSLFEKAIEAIQEDSSFEAFDSLASLAIELLQFDFQQETQKEIPRWFVVLAESAAKDDLHFEPSIRLISVFLNVLNTFPNFKTKFVNCDYSPTFRLVARRLWDFLEVNANPETSVVVSLLLQLHNHYDGESGSVVLEVLVEKLSHSSSRVRMRGFQKFAILWEASHLKAPDLPLFCRAMHLVLDCLDAPEPSLRHQCRAWLSGACSRSIAHVLDPLFEELLHSDLRRSSGLIRHYHQVYDVPRAVYVLGRLTAIILADHQAFISAAQTTRVSPRILKLNWQHTHEAALSDTRSDYAATAKNEELPTPQTLFWGYGDDRCVIDYLDLLCVTASRFVQTENASLESREFELMNLAARSAAIELLRVFVSNHGPPHKNSRPSDTRALLAPPLIAVLVHAIEKSDFVIQAQILELLKLILPHSTGAIPDASRPPIHKMPSLENVIGPQLEQRQLLEIAAEAKVRQLERSHQNSIYMNLLPAILLALESLAGAVAGPADGVGALSRHVGFAIFVVESAPLSLLCPLVEPLLVKLCMSSLECSRERQHPTPPNPAISIMLSGILSLLRLLVAVKQPELVEKEGTPDPPKSSWLFSWILKTSSFDNPLLTLPFTIAEPQRFVIRKISPLLVKALCTIVHSSTPHPSSKNASLESFSLSTQKTLRSMQSSLAQSVNAVLAPDPPSAERDDWGVVMALVAKLVREILARFVLPEFLLAIVYVRGLAIADGAKEGRDFSVEAADAAPCVLAFALTPAPLSSAPSSSVSSRRSSGGREPGVVAALETLLLLLRQKMAVPHPQRGNVSSSKQVQFAEALRVSDLPRESALLELGDLILRGWSETPDPHTLWEWVFELIETMLPQSREPTTALWVFSLILTLDLRLPSRDSVLGVSSAKRRARLLHELCSSVVHQASRKYHTSHLGGSGVFKPDLQPPLPPFVASLLGGGSASSPSSDWREPVAVRRPRSGSGVGAEETDAVEVVAQYAMSALLALCHQLSNTQRRTTAAAVLMQGVVDALPRTLLPAALQSSASEHMQLQYLAIHLVNSLPTDLLHFCGTVAKRLVADFVDVCGGSPLSGNLFSGKGSSDGAIFKSFDRRTFRSFCAIVGRVLSADADNQLFELVTSPHVSRVFGSREADFQNRLCELKRISIFLLSTEDEVSPKFVSLIVERILECLRGESQSQLAAFLLLRILIFKKLNLQSAWPIILTELIRVLTTMNSLCIYLSVLKVIDIAILLDIPEFHLHQWIFVLEAPASIQANGTYEGPIFQPLCGRQKGKIQFEGLEGGSGVLRKPLINIRKIESTDQVKEMAFLLFKYGVKNCIEKPTVDYEALLRSIENDLLEVEDALLDWV